MINRLTRSVTDAITLDRVTKIYRTPSLLPWSRSKAVEALQHVSFSCPTNSISCLLGPNGAGKTTIIKILAGLILPDAGTARVLGISLSESAPGLFSRIGLVTSNERSFYWRLTGYQNLWFFASLYGLRGRERRERVMEVLADVALEDQSDKPFRHYSTGMRQRLLLARALLGRPEVLLLDEPTIHLDPSAQEMIHRFIKEQLLAERKTTILFSTHNLSEAERLSDYVVIIHNGKILTQGAISVLRSQTGKRFHMEMDFASLPGEGWENGLDIKVCRQNGNRITCELVEAATRRGGRLLSLRRSPELLADIFANMMDRRVY